MVDHAPMMADQTNTNERNDKMNISNETMEELKASAPDNEEIAVVNEPTEADEAEDEDEDTAADAPEAASTPSEKDAPETATPQKPKKAAPPSMEERMLEMFLREKHPDTLKTALAKGKTIRGAWDYVVSVMKNAYITAHGRVNGGMCGSPDVVVGIAERYLREFPEGYTEPEAAHTPKKKTEAKPSANAKTAAKTAVATVKAAAKDAKSEAKAKKQKMMNAWASEQLTLF